MSISAAQCRAARALLDWTQDQLAENAHVARATVADFERNARMPIRNNRISIVSALEAAGVAFIPENDEGAGVRFRKVELEYNTNVRPMDGGVVVSVRYRGVPYSVVISQAIIDDIDRTIYKKFAERVTAVQNHFPVFLRVAEETIIRGQIVDDNFVHLTHENFPDGTF